MRHALQRTSCSRCPRTFTWTFGRPASRDTGSACVQCLHALPSAQTWGQSGFEMLCSTRTYKFMLTMLHHALAAGAASQYSFCVLW